MQIIFEIDRIIPNVKALGAIFPILECIYEYGFLTVGAKLGIFLKRLVEPAGYGAKPYDHVVSRMGDFRSGQGILICKSVNEHAWIVCFNILGKCVYKSDDGALWALFFSFHGKTVFAKTSSAVVVLRYGKYGAFGILYDPLAKLCPCDFINAWICKTNLRVSDSLSVNFGKIFGMGVKIFLFRHKISKRVVKVEPLYPTTLGARNVTET